MISWCLVSPSSNSFNFHWRPQSLCNACGIRYRKKKRQDLSLDQKEPPPRQQQHNGEEAITAEVKDSTSNSNSSSGSSNLQVVQERKLLMGVEEAALLLMTLSSPPPSTLLHGWQIIVLPSPNAQNVHTYKSMLTVGWFWSNQIVPLFVRMR